MIKRYECFTEWGGTNYEATLIEDGQWVSYDDHLDAMQRLRQTAATQENVNVRALEDLQAELRIYKLLVAGGTR